MSDVFPPDDAFRPPPSETGRSRSCACCRIRSRPSPACSAACCSTTAFGTGSATCCRTPDYYRFEHQLIQRGRQADQREQAGRRHHGVRAAPSPEGQSDKAGGLAYLNQLAQYVPSAVTSGRYAEIVRERAILRKLIKVSDDIATRAFNPGVPRSPRSSTRPSRRCSTSARRAPAWKQGWSMDTLVVDLLDRVTEMADNPNDVTGVPTGFVDLDRMTSGLQAGDMVVLAARPRWQGAAARLRACARCRAGRRWASSRSAWHWHRSTAGRPSIVTGIFPQGRRQVWRVTLSDGRSAECCDEHLWRVSCRHWEAPRVLSTAEIRQLLTRQRTRTGSGSAA